MLRIVADETADPRRRDKLAKAAAPFLHATPARSGKKANAAPYDRFPGVTTTVVSPKIVALERDATVRERMKRYRRRQRGGRLFASIDFAPEETARLNRLGYLRESELEDREAIAAAIHALLGNIADEP